MSTRSGKRLHNSINEDIGISDEVAIKSERKTRSSKHLKENIRNISNSNKTIKKRKNYVKYPSDDELSTEVNVDIDNRSISTKLKNALKEKNITNEIDVIESAKNNVRTTRSIKKLLNNDTEIVQESDSYWTNKTAEKSKSKKNKRKKIEEVLNEVPKSKSRKKKGRKLGSLVVEDLVSNNERNDSLDSFHSAASSPYKEQSAEINIHSSKSKKTCSEDIWVHKSESDSSNQNLIFDDKESTENIGLHSSQKNKKSKKNSYNSPFVKINDTTFEKDELKGDLNKKDFTKNLSLSNTSGPTINVNLNTTYEKDINDTYNEKQNVTFDNENGTISKSKTNKKKPVDATEEASQIMRTSKQSSSKKKKSVIHIHVDKENSIIDNGTNFNTKANELQLKRKFIFNSTYEKENLTNIEDVNNSVIKINHSSIKDTTFEKDNEYRANSKTSTEKSDLKKNTLLEDSALDNLNHVFTFNSETNTIHRKSNINDTTFEKSNSSIVDLKNTTFEKKSDNILQSRKNICLKNYYIDQDEISLACKTALISSPSSFYKEYSNSESASKKHKNDTTFEVENAKTTICNNTYDNNLVAGRPSILKSNNSLKTDQIFLNEENTENEITKDIDFQNKVAMNNITFETQLDGKSTKGRKSIQEFSQANSTDKNIVVVQQNHDITIEKIKRKSSTPVHESNLNETFEKSSKSSLISSDGSTQNIDKSLNNTSNISITSDESENIVNTTPVLIESSIDETLNNTLHTPLKREGTFTKDSAVPTEQKSSKLTSITPEKQVSLPSAGCTPFHISGSRNKSMMNVTRSLEKDKTLSVDPVPRVTKVMFCSPTFDPVAASHQKKKIIKSNLKGSNKSFVYEESAPCVRAVPRKRSYTQSDADETRVKRSRLVDCQQNSVDRLSRPRTSSASAKLTDATTPTKRTPQKAKSEPKVTRTKLPNFAALHRKQFDQMESLDECQRRKAKRAKQLLTPTGNIDVLERISPKGPVIVPQKQKALTKPEIKKLPTLDSLKPGYSRFGFKFNMDNNPFTIPRKVEVTKNPPKILPSLAGSTMRKDVAKQVVMREKSLNDKRASKRHENRTIIKGVRTNRRFELQMKLRNLD